MESMSKGRKLNLSITGGVYLALFLVTAVLFYRKGIDRLEPVYILNVGIDMAMMLTGYVLYICCLIDIQKAGADYRYYLFLLNTVIIGLFTDAVAWLVDGIPSLRVINIVDNVIYYMCGVFSAYFFWLYIRTFINSGRKSIKYIGYAVNVGLVVFNILIFSNFFTHLYFFVDEQGFYHRTNLFFISNIYVYSTLLVTLCVALKERKRMQSFQLMAIVMYVISPLIVMIMTVGIYGLSITFGYIMIIMLLMYCVINVTQGREKAVADRDLSTAAAIQARMLPNIFPPFPDREEFDIYAYMDTAKEVGGDFYDFFLIDEDHLALVMADVAGKGVPAALFMMISRTLIKNALLNGESPENALCNVNNRLLDGNDTKMFVTVWLAVVEISTGKGVAVNAGHEHPVLRRAEGQYEIIKYKHYPVVAMMKDIKYMQHEFVLNPGDSLFVYTDGVAEAGNAEGELFGTEKMLKALNKDPDAKPKAVIENVRNAIDLHVQGAEQSDDITMMCLRYMGSNYTGVN